MATVHKHSLLCSTNPVAGCCSSAPLRKNSVGWEPACADPCFTCIIKVTGCYITGRQPMSSRYTEWRHLTGEVNGFKCTETYICPGIHFLEQKSWISLRWAAEKMLTDYAAHLREESQRKKRETESERERKERPRAKEKVAPSVTNSL